MDWETPKEDVSFESAVWKETRRTFHGGGRVRRLPAEVLSEEEIFIVTMKPPALRDIVRILFCEDEPSADRGVEAVVTEVSYCPKDVAKCGFIATVVNPERMFSVASPAQMRSVDVCPVPMTDRERAERRADPRIRTDVPATVQLPGKTLFARVLNLSMSGALVGFERDQIPPEMNVGALVRMDAHDARDGAAPSLKAEIVRLIGVGRPSNAGVRFIDMDSDASLEVERIILNEIQVLNSIDQHNSGIG